MLAPSPDDFQTQEGRLVAVPDLRLCMAARHVLAPHPDVRRRARGLQCTHGAERQLVGRRDLGRRAPAAGGRFRAGSRGARRHLRCGFHGRAADGARRGHAHVFAGEVHAAGRRTHQDRAGRDHDGRWFRLSRCRSPPLPAGAAHAGARNRHAGVAHSRGREGDDPFAALQGHEPGNAARHRCLRRTLGRAWRADEPHLAEARRAGQGGRCAGDAGATRERLARRRPDHHHDRRVARARSPGHTFRRSGRSPGRSRWARRSARSRPSTARCSRSIVPSNKRIAARS